MYADVAVCLPLSRTFAYRISESIEVGCRVVVPFRKREVEGFVVALHDAVPKVEVLAVKEIVDKTPLLRPEIFKLCLWISEYYVSPLGEVLKGALPPGITAKHVERGAVESVPSSRSSGDEGADPVAPCPSLTSEQACAFDAITSSKGFHPVLLHGITGSGKTEVYMRAAEHFLAACKASLILVP